MNSNRRGSAAPENNRNGKTAHPKSTEPIPEGFNYDFWLGRAPDAPYSPARCHVDFRWILDYSGGQVSDWGGHHPDIAQWMLNRPYRSPWTLEIG